MIRQQIGDVLEINFDENWFYLIILTKIAMFGGNIVFAFHNDGKKMALNNLLEIKEGFNICTDLLWIKRNGLVQRIGKIKDVESYFYTKFVKGAHETRKDIKAKRWFIYRIDDLGRHIDVVENLSNRYKKAMDYGTFSFDLVAEKVLQRYTPDQDGRI
jgi:hypothetical protein